MGDQACLSQWTPLLIAVDPQQSRHRQRADSRREPASEHLSGSPDLEHHL